MSSVCGLKGEHVEMSYTIGMFLKASADSISCAACTRDIVIESTNENAVTVTMQGEERSWR